jgi:Zn-finger in ubiquitin-hydrolases and other protein
LATLDGVEAVSCSHLDQIKVEKPEEFEGCEECLKMGATWVHLRVCRTCGLVACCDSSPNKHASAHAAASGHPIVSSLEPREDWSWCYQDEVSFVIA